MGDVLNEPSHAFHKNLMEGHGLKFFASPIKFGIGGSLTVLPFDQSVLSEYETRRVFDEVVPQLQDEIARGLL